MIEAIAIGGVIAAALFLFTLRKKPQACSTCAKPMLLLSESEEDRYLTIEQQAEENLGIINHDVWVCVKCEEVRVVEEVRKGGHERCPSCQRATLDVKNTVLRQPTKSAPGIERIEQDCDACGYTKSVECQIAPIGSLILGNGGAQTWKCATCGRHNDMGAIDCRHCSFQTYDPIDDLDF